MDYSAVDFSQGVAGCFKVWEAVGRQGQMLEEERERAQREDDVRRAMRAGQALKALEKLPPLWQRISGLNPEAEKAMRPMVRRSRMLKLVRAAEAIYRAELAAPTTTGYSNANEEAEGTAIFSARSVFWDPVAESCYYLEIAPSKLNAYCSQLTGLRAKDLADRVRLGDFKKRMRERLSAAFEEWRSTQKQFTPDALRAMTSRAAGLAFLRAVRRMDVLPTRSELALEIGLSSRQRLDRAVLACEGKTVEMIELELAALIFEEWRAGEGGRQKAEGGGTVAAFEGQNSRLDAGAGELRDAG